MNNSREIEYFPLTSEASYKVIQDHEFITVKGTSGEMITFAQVKKDHCLSLELKDSNTTNLRLPLLLTFEYCFGHDSELSAVRSLDHHFERSEFFQLQELWHHQKTFSWQPESWTATNGVNHPRRLPPHSGVVYKRYIPNIGKTVTFREIRDSDLDTFHEWHNQFRVYHFWELNKPKEELRIYLERGKQDAHQFPMIAEIDGEMAGYYEMYWVAEDRLGPYYECDPFDRGFHFLIGNKKFLGPTTDAIIKSGLHFLFLDDPRTRRIMAEPRHDNQKVLRYAEASAGWRKIKEFDFPHKRAALLECRKEYFYQGNAL